MKEQEENKHEGMECQRICPSPRSFIALSLALFLAMFLALLFALSSALF
jgi:hypothetical protein